MTVGMWLKCSDELIWTSKIKNNLLKKILKKNKNDKLLKGFEKSWKNTAEY